MRATSTALPDVNRRKAPPPPSWLPKARHPDYRAVWRSSVAHLWPTSAAEQVARLVVLRFACRKVDEVTPAQLSVLLQLERELLLGPKSARASGVTVRDESAPDVADTDDDEAKPRRRKATRVDRARRERVLRVVEG